MGLTQNSRALAPLRAGWLSVDGRTPRRLLAETLPVTGLFNYFDAPDRKNGQWDAFYAQVPLVRYAALAEIDLTGKTERFRALFTRLMGPDQRFRFEPEDPLQLAAVRGLVGELLFGYQGLDREAEIFAGFLHENSFAAMLLRAIREVLAADYRSVYPWKKWLENREQGRLPPLRLPWWGEPVEDAKSLDPTVLYRAAWAGQSVLEELVAQARARFEFHFEKPWNLPPHFALYLAFIRQFGGAQAALNELPSRHRDYFYRQVLMLRPRPALPDTAFVAFTAAPQSWVSLPAGTALDGGKDPTGAPLVYATTRETEVTNSALAEVATLWTGPDGSGGFYEAPRADSADGQGAPLQAGAGWQPFGADQRSLPAGAGRFMKDAVLGFAVSSPVLHLEEGVRQVTLTLNFDGDPTPAVTTESRAAAAAASPDFPGEIAYTGPQGWVAVEPAAIKFAVGSGPDGGALEIDFTLPETAAPCLNYQAKLHGPGYDGRAPAVRLLFSHPQRAVAAGVRASNVRSFALRVRVSGVTNLTLLGAGGKLTPGKPMPLFGAPPQLGSPLLIGAVEMARKPLQALSLTARWQGLPTDPARYPAGLSDYFAPYIATVTNPDPKMFRNDQYRISLDALANSGSTPLVVRPDSLFAWTPAKSAEEQQSNPGSVVPGGGGADAAPTGVLQTSTTWNVDPGSLAHFTPVPGLAGPLTAAPAARTGFLSMALLAPDYLFGQTIYAPAMAQITAENALTMIAAARTPATLPAQAASAPSARSAYALLRTPATGFTAWLRRAFRVGSKPAYTFKADLFSALAEKGISEAVAQAVQAAGKVQAKDLPAKLKGLAGRRFSDAAGFRALIAQAAEVDNPDSDAIGALIQALAALVVPPPASEATTASAPAPAGLSLLPLPPPPLVPTAVSLTLNYEAAVTITLPAAPEPAGGGSQPWHRLWQVSPFAISRVGASQPLLPVYPAGGALYLGFRGVEPPETLSLLFVLEALTQKQLAALSESPLPPLDWSWLVGDQWCDVAHGETLSAQGQTAPNRHNVHDGTNGLQRSGIIRIDLPPEADTAHTIMPDGLVWLRVRTTAPAARLRVIQILPHAAPVAWVPPAGAAAAELAEHFARPLPAGALGALVMPNPAIAKIVQPLPSAGGSPPEENEQFALRVSEHLRHKGRAIAGPDYERLLLQRYPEVFSAQVLRPASVAEAGAVRVVVLPVVKTVPSDVPPVFLPGDLKAMAVDLQGVAPLSARVTVINPDYVWLIVNAEVQFRRDRSFQAYAAQLSADLNAFISPWLYAQSTVADPARSFRLSELTAYVRRLPYVEFLAACSLERGDDSAGAFTAVGNDAGGDPLIAPDGPASLLIGVPAHHISMVAVASV